MKKILRYSQAHLTARERQGGAGRSSDSFTSERPSVSGKNGTLSGWLPGSCAPAKGVKQNALHFFMVLEGSAQQSLAQWNLMEKDYNGRKQIEVSGSHDHLVSGSLRRLLGSMFG